MTRGGTSGANLRGARSAAFAGLLALAIGMGVGRFIYTPILPGMLQALGLGAAEAGVVAAANFLGYLAGALAAAMLGAQMRRPALLLAALAASVATTAAMAGVHSVAAMSAIRFASGVASAFVFVGATTVTLEALARRERADLAALHYAGVGVGVAASALIVAGVAQAGYGWQAEWLAAAAASLIALAVVAALLPREPPPTQTDAATARPSGRVAPFVIAYGLVGFGYVVTATFLVAIVRESGGGAYETAVWLVVGLAAAPSILVWSRIARRIGVSLAFAIACVAEAAGVVASVAWPGLAGALVAAILLGGTFMGLTALGIAGARRASACDGRRLVAVMTASFGVGQIIGPLVAGALREATGDYVVASFAAAAALLVAAALGVAGGRG